MTTPRVVLVSFIGPRRTIDAAANAELPVRDLLAPVQAILGVDTLAAGPEAAGAQLLPAGDETRTRPVDLAHSLDELGAVDGDVITFTPVPRPHLRLPRPTLTIDRPL